MGTNSDEIVELREDLSGSPYYNRDMAPVPRSERKWGMKDIAALWISMAACVTTYTLASSSISQGFSWWQSVLTIFIGNVIVLIPMVLNAHAGTRYGIPFPVYCRASFGLLGANVPALLRALVACGWFGIQSWIGGWAIYKVLEMNFPEWQQLPLIDGLGITWPQFACFLFFWSINILIIYLGIESIRILLNFKAPLLIGLGLALLAWAVLQARAVKPDAGFGPMFAEPSRLHGREFWHFFFPALTAAVGYWATLSLNIPDFSRYAHSQRDQVLGQALGLPTTMALYSFIGAAVTSAAVIIYPNVAAKELWEPINLITRFANPIVLALALFALSLATLATNIAANVVSPANDFAHVWPRYIGFRTGGLITGLIGIAIQPWRLYNDPSGYIYTWLIGYSSLLGAIGGILLADYYIIRRTKLDLAGLYRKLSPYWYSGGFNLVAIVALLAGIAPCVPGFLATITELPFWERFAGYPLVFTKTSALDAIAKTYELKNAHIITFSDFWVDLYSYAWFVSFGVAFVVYLVCTPVFRSSASAKVIPKT
ncbi:MAG: NCS1 family nucleobase:cation symporter-1 [Gemmataceae bacterium]